jgi:hypothetical protein
LDISRTNTLSTTESSLANIVDYHVLKQLERFRGVRLTNTQTIWGTYAHIVHLTLPYFSKDTSPLLTDALKKFASPGFGHIDQLSSREASPLSFESLSCFLLGLSHSPELERCRPLGPTTVSSGKLDQGID